MYLMTLLLVYMRLYTNSLKVVHSVHFALLTFITFKEVNPSISCVPVSMEGMMEQEITSYFSLTIIEAYNHTLF